MVDFSKFDIMNFPSNFCRQQYLILLFLFVFRCEEYDRDHFRLEIRQIKKGMFL